MVGSETLFWADQVGGFSVDEPFFSQVENSLDVVLVLSTSWWHAADWCGCRFLSVRELLSSGVLGPVVGFVDRFLATA